MLKDYILPLMPPEAPQEKQLTRSSTHAGNLKMLNNNSAVSLARTATSKHSLAAFKTDKNRLKNIIETSTVEINDSINFNRRVFSGRGQ